MAQPKHETTDASRAPELMSTKELLDLYRLTQDVRKYHHSALWEIEKHFTWWASILLGACVLILANVDKVGEPAAYYVLGVIAFVGALLSIMGKTVVEKEGEYFGEALQICNRVARVLGLESRQYNFPPRRRSNSQMEPAQFSLYPGDYWISTAVRISWHRPVERASSGAFGRTRRGRPGEVPGLCCPDYARASSRWMARSTVGGPSNG